MTTPINTSTKEPYLFIGLSTVLLVTLFVAGSAFQKINCLSDENSAAEPARGAAVKAETTAIAKRSASKARLVEAQNDQATAAEELGLALEALTTIRAELALSRSRELVGAVFSQIRTVSERAALIALQAVPLKSNRAFD